MTDCYAVFGNPVMHSKSPLIHTHFAKTMDQDLQYAAIEAPVGAFAAAVDAFRRDGGRGCNITTPFKLDAFAYATALTDRAKRAGAINCLRFDGETATGENYDGVGLLNDIQRNLGCPLPGRRVLVLGAGGSVRGLLEPFLAAQPAVLVIANRTPGKAEALAEAFSAIGPAVPTSYSGLADQASFDLVVNATSASMRGELPPVAARSFASGCLAYELAYGRGLTPFLRAARDAGAGHIADGVGMLVEQAAEAFEWWRGVRPTDTASLIQQLTVPLR